MSRSLALAIVLALGFVAPEAGAQSLDGVQVAALDEDPSGEQAFADEEGYEDEYDEDYADEDYADEEMEYCGGGEMSLVDEIWDEMEYGDPASAHDTLVDALQTGDVDPWERGRALSLLAELQLRRGEPGRAIVNFQRAEHISPGVTDMSRVARATALYQWGERRQARVAARTAHEELCSDQYAVAGCYAANLILAETERAPGERLAAADAAATLRRANPDLANALDEVDVQVAGS